MLLSTLPLLANAAMIGGFEVKDRQILEKVGKDTYLYYFVDNEPYTGFFNGTNFVLGNVAKGKNKFWLLLSAKKGSYVGNSKNIRSLLTLFEVDCVEYRSRLLRQLGYSDYFTQGKIAFQNNEVDKWHYQQNGSTIMGVGCGLLDAEK